MRNRGMIRRRTIEFGWQGGRKISSMAKPMVVPGIVMGQDVRDDCIMLDLGRAEGVQSSRVK